jgi:hypothetical protein
VGRGSVWLPAPNPRGLSQGDILVDVPVGVTRVPLTFVSHASFEDRRGKTIWTEYDSLQPLKEDSAGHWLAKGRITRALVLTHSCDLDDLRDSERVLIAPIAEITMVTSGETDRRRIMDGARSTYVSLPGVPGIGDCYADLRSICPIDRFFFSPANRLCSMTDEAVAILRAQLVVHFTRLEPQHLVNALQAQIFDENNR